MVRKKKKVDATKILGIAALAAGIWYIVKKPKSPITTPATTQ